MNASTDPVLNKPAHVEAAGLWFFARGVTSPTHAIDERGRHLVRGWFDRADDDKHREAVKAAKAGGFYVDHFRDEDGDRALVIDSSRLPATA